MRHLFWPSVGFTFVSLVLFFVSHQYSIGGPAVQVGPWMWVSIGGGCVWMHNDRQLYRGSILSVEGDPDPPRVTGGDLPGFYIRIITHRSNAAWWTVACSPLYFLVVFMILALIARWYATRLN